MAQRVIQGCGSCHEEKPIRPGDTMCAECGAIWFPADPPEVEEDDPMGGMGGTVYQNDPRPWG